MTQTPPLRILQLPADTMDNATGALKATSKAMRRAGAVKATPKSMPRAKVNSLVNHR